jgi:hypothetical protein
VGEADEKVVFGLYAAVVPEEGVNALDGDSREVMTGILYVFFILSSTSLSLINGLSLQSIFHRFFLFLLWERRFSIGDEHTSSPFSYSRRLHIFVLSTAQ